MLKIALIGYGKMGRMVEKEARSRNHEIVSIIDPSLENTEISPETIGKADLCIEFTRPDCVLANIRKVLKLNKTLITGTTGWDASLDQVKEWVAETDSGLFYASNFSLGVNYFIKTVERAAELFLKSGNYDVAGLEIHHNQKLDAPSGTALTIRSSIAKSGKIPADRINFSSVRCGSTPGTHTIYFDSPADTVTLTHQARNRDDFALGAVTAAEWMQNKKGVFTMEDLLCLN